MTRFAKRGVYLLHFDVPYHHAAHYIGFATDIPARIEEHRRGTGARLMEVIKNAGIGFTLARTWSGQSRAFERQLKKRHGAAALCLFCRREIL